MYLFCHGCSFLLLIYFLKRLVCCLPIFFKSSTSTESHCLYTMLIKHAECTGYLVITESLYGPLQWLWNAWDYSCVIWCIWQISRVTNCTRKIFQGFVFEQTLLNFTRTSSQFQKCTFDTIYGKHWLLKNCCLKVIKHNFLSVDSTFKISWAKISKKSNPMDRTLVEHW